ncbi:hypothetical protein CTAYLR_006932 [Chrysophaeum taylorii]|uniref:YdbS-like PH domain-containing protein n=1 Tax=Chrysophaeum taylorii TaxID=2483200 RepID=A0AAD7U9B9_9STRA|nr:hypothetical protein CTAYLR_006932 [Chrysophaeum taylorii]
MIALALVVGCRALVAPLGVPVRHRPLMMARGRLLDELSKLDDDAGGDDEPPVVPALKETLEAETLFFEGPPSWTELVLPTFAILTVIGIIPFMAAVARQVWVRYKITSRRISVQSGIGGNDLTEIIYPDIVGLKYVFRSGGDVGDMVVELKDGAKLEMRHLGPDFPNIYKYILAKVSQEAQDNSFAMS